MVIISLMIILVLMGFVFLYLTEMIPLFQLMQMEWIAAIVISIPVFAMIMRLATSRSLKIFESKPPGKELGFFLRRDGICELIYTSRPFWGESYLAAPKVGLVHDLGRGSVYRLGNKNIRFILENVMHTPDPKFVNYTSWLYNIGFNNMSEIADALNGGKFVETIRELPSNNLDDIKHHVDMIKKLEVKNDDSKKQKPESKSSFGLSWFKRKT